MKVEETPGETPAEVTPAETPVVETPTEIPVETPTETPEETPEDGNNEAMDSVLAALNGLPGGDQLKESLDIIKEEESKTETPVETPETPSEKKPETPEEIAAEILKNKKPAEVTPAETPKEEETVITSPIFGGEQTIGKPTTTPDPITYDGSDVANKYIKDKTGLENLESLVSSSLNLQKKTEEFDSMSSQVKQYEGVFANLPPELYKAVDLSLKGEDWKSEIMSKPNLDFAQTVENQSDKNLVENYMPNEFSKEDWTEYNSEEGDANLKRTINMAINTAKSKYNTDRQKIESFQKDSAKQAQDKVVLMEASTNASIAHLEKNIPGIDPSYVGSIKQNMTIQKLGEIFLNPDGSFKESAALNMVMATEGYAMMEQYKQIAIRKTENKERQDVLERTPTTPKAKKTAAETPGKISSEAQKRINQLSSGFVTEAVY